MAIKVLKREAAAAAAAVAQQHQQFMGAGNFRNELEVLSKYHHHNIVELLGYCLDDGGSGGGAQGGTGWLGMGRVRASPQRQCLVFEWMAGGSLQSRLLAANRAALTAKQRFDIASDIARCLEYVHTKADPPIIQQDVSSDNILLNVIDGALVAKVVDFGKARYAPALLEKGRTHHTTGIVIGKKSYQPYEYTNRGHVSEKTNTFAFGVVLCELLTGEPPKDRESGEMLAAKMLEPLADSEHALPRLLDKRLGAGEAWPLGRAIRLGCVAARCIEVMPEARCIVADVLPELNAIAGRKAIRRAGRGEEYDPMTGELVQIAAVQQRA
jgi:serine/threonine protein kinase